MKLDPKCFAYKVLLAVKMNIICQVKYPEVLSLSYSAIAKGSTSSLDALRCLAPNTCAGGSAPTTC